MINYKQATNKLWSEQDIVYIFWRLLLFCQNLSDSNIFHSNWKPDNVSVFINDYQSSVNPVLQVKLFNFQGASIDYKTVHLYNKFFAPPNIKYITVSSKAERLSIELY